LRWFHDEAIVVEGSPGDPQFLQGILLDITEKKEAEEQLIASRHQLRHLAAHIETVREEERTWIAREIHDELGQSLTGLKMELSWLEKKIAHRSHSISTPLLQEKLESMKELVDTTISSVRRIATQLRPGILDSLGLIAAIEWQATDFQARTGIECMFSLLPDNTLLDDRRSSAIFRILQEILTNVVRHANATCVSIDMREEAGNLIMEVEDNGRGITDEEKSNVRSLGLLGMKERANLLGGEVKIMRSDVQGTKVIVQVPILSEVKQSRQSGLKI
jgi:signal transduction histidine kinase